MGVSEDRRIVVFIGHFGSGKTECAVNYALRVRRETGAKTAIVDLDIANPFFRSREKKDMMEALGIENLSNLYGRVITDEVPAIDPAIRRPLENREYRAVVDAGGDPSGAKLLMQFQDLLQVPDCDVLAVLNANRPITATAEKAVPLLEGMERASGLRITGLVNNTHMLRRTTVEDIVKGYRLARQVGDRLGLPVRYSTCEEGLLPALREWTAGEPIEGEIFPIRLEMRDSWLDEQV